MSRGFVAVFCLLVHPFLASAEVTSVTIMSRVSVAGGQSFGTTGPYEKLVGRIEFALDPTDPHNGRIVDLERAPRGTDGRVRFSSALYVLRPSDPARGNGVLFFEVANRGRKSLLTRFLTMSWHARGFTGASQHAIADWSGRSAPDVP